MIELVKPSPTIRTNIPAIARTEIPAVMMFNYLTGRVEAFDVEMDNSSSELIDYFLKKRGDVRR